MKSFTFYLVNTIVILLVCNSVLGATWWTEPANLSDRNSWVSLSTGGTSSNTGSQGGTTTTPTIPINNGGSTGSGSTSGTGSGSGYGSGTTNSTSGGSGSVVTGTQNNNTGTGVGVDTGSAIPSRCIGRTGYAPTCPCTSNCWFVPTVTQGMCTCGSLEDTLALHEGKRHCVYNDQVGIATIGIGFNMIQRTDSRALITGLGLSYDAVLSGSQCLSDSQISSLFNNDIGWAKTESRQCISNFSQHSQ